MKKNIKIGVVILHYNNVEDTIECVDSFRKNIDTDDYFLLVFDNASPNGSGKILKERFANYDKLEVYLNDKNLGFGGGNNKGINIIREKYDPDYIVLSNNDIVLLDKEFYKKIECEYERCEFALLGPMIITADGRCDSNPIFDVEYTEYAANYDLKVMQNKLKAYKFHVFKPYMTIRQLAYRLSKKLREKRPQIRKKRDAGIFLERRENIVCHGCFMVFSKTFFKVFDGLDIRSFMYAEEDILYKHLMDEKMITVYSPQIIVYHKEGQSVRNTYEKNREKEIFLLEKHIEANKGYLSLLEELSEKNKF